MIRASVPKLDLDSTFEQKNDIAKTVENELEKVNYFLVIYLSYNFEIYAEHNIHRLDSNCCCV